MDVFHPNTGEVRSDGPEGIACWFIDTDYNQESFFVRHAYFLGAGDPYKSLKTTLKAEIDEDAWATLNRATSRPFPPPGVRPHSRQGHQPPRRRGDEGVPGVTDGFSHCRHVHRQPREADRRRAEGRQDHRFDLQLDPAAPGLSFHKLNRVKDKNFLSVRVNRDIRLIVHRTAASLLLCYVNHHDEAYRWAERRKIERHPKTGAAQLVEIREIVRSVEVQRGFVREASMVPAYATKPPPFADMTDDGLLAHGVPPEWLDEVRNADENALLALADHLPAEAAEALLELATGGTPERPSQAAPDADPFAHPDARRRFRIVANAAELERALEYPWEKWTVFLHPAQRRLVERDFGGPARVSGSAGTGKTIVALHRAVHLAEAHPEARVLLTTFSDALANALRVKLRRLIGSQAAHRRAPRRALDGWGRAAPL